MDELISAGATLIGSLGPLLAKALVAKQEEHAAIMAEAASVGAVFNESVSGFVAKLAANDIAADAALEEKTEESKEDTQP